ncbi:MAG: AMP-binding protein [Clostridia bacterium]|nr:AMP-binding protein [Clostridia bacterium]
MTRPLYDVREFYTFRELLTQSMAIYGNSPAFKVKNAVGQIEDVSYDRFHDEVFSLGTALLALGLKDARIAVAGANSYKWCVSYMAVTCGAGVVVPTDKELPFADIKSILEVSEAKAIIFDKKFGKKILEHRDELPEGMVYIAMDITEDDGDILSFDKLLADGARLIEDGNEEYINITPDSNKLAVLLFTSGTTGMSKAVMLSARNICSDIMSIMGVVKINKGERIMSLLPIHHTYECTVTFLCCIYGGVSICFCDGLRYITKNLQEYQPHILIVVPRVIELFYARIQKALEKEKGAKLKIGIASRLAKATKKIGVDTSNLFFGKIKEAFGGKIRLIISGAAGIDPTIIENMNKYGIQTFQGYGLTECSPIVICNSDKDMKHASIGRPIPGVEAKLVGCDENGIGELCIKGPMVMLGYYKNEDATNAVFDYDGWFHTGDLASVDKDGFYYICGRSKNVIVTSNGKNVYPEELEALLMKEAAVKECMVVESKDDKDNVVVKARIFPDVQALSQENGNRILSEKEISSFVNDAVRNVNEQVVSYKAIKSIEIMEKEFEKTTTAKIKRNQ